jgi:hypothetical protein
MFCIHCGKEIEAEASFCSHCGAKNESIAESVSSSRSSGAVGSAGFVRPSGSAGLAGSGQPAAKTVLNIAGVSGRPVQFYISFILSGLITVGFFFKWLEILGQGLLSFFGAAPEDGYGVIGAIGAFVDLAGRMDNFSYGFGMNRWLVLVILLLVAQCLIPILNAKYCYDLYKTWDKVNGCGKTASTASIFLSALFIAVIFIGNAYISSESGGWVKEIFRVKGAPYFILCAALVNRCFVIPSLAKLMNDRRV